MFRCRRTLSANTRVLNTTGSAHVTSFSDMLPTLAEIAGAQVPKAIDGISIVLLTTSVILPASDPEPAYWISYNLYELKYPRKELAFHLMPGVRSQNAA